MRNINDSSNFDCIRQIDGENNELYMIAIKGTIAAIITRAVNKTVMLILTLPSLK